VQKFLTQLPIKRPFWFSLHLMSASALPGKTKTSDMCIEMNKKNFNKFHIFGLAAPNRQSITQFNCHAAVCQLEDLPEC